MESSEFTRLPVVVEPSPFFTELIPLTTVVKSRLEIWAGRALSVVVWGVK